MIKKMSIQENDAFEFTINLSSNSSAIASPTSPADHFFLNGKLLPHFFPSHDNKNNNNLHNCRAIYSRSTSRTSSVSSKDSFSTSRSNSSSTYSSSRTSTSTSTSESPLTNHHPAGVMNKDYFTRKSSRCPQKPVKYRCRSSTSQRWQFITAVPVMKQSVFCTRKRQSNSKNVAQRKKTKSNKKDNKGGNNAGTWFGLRFFMSFVSACIKCHSFQTSSSTLSV